jgi:predicted MFS family arabinose efflux permease
MVLGVGSGIWGAATLALPVATTAVSLFLMRFLFGIGHSVRFPSQASSLHRWFAPEQRALALGICFSGGQVGLAVGSMVSAFLLHQFGWQAVFYGIGGASLLFSLLWLALYPDKTVGLTAPGHFAVAQKKVSWGSLLRHPPVWGMAFGQMGYLYAYFFFLTWLPGYLVLERKMTVLRTGLVASLPFWMGMLGTVGGGWLGDYLIRRGFSRTVSRKTMIGSGLLLSTVTVVAAAFTHRTWLAVVLLTLCMGCMRMATGSCNATPIDLAPPHAVGSVTSVQNFIGTFGGLLAAIVTGYIVQATGSFVAALVVAGGMALMGAFCYVFLVRRFEPLDI